MYPLKKYKSLCIKWVHLSVDGFHSLKSMFQYNQSCGYSLATCCEFALTKRLWNRYCSLTLVMAFGVSSIPMSKNQETSWCYCPWGNCKYSVWPEQRQVKRSCLINEVSYESKNVLAVILKASHMKHCLRNSDWRRNSYLSVEGV